MTFRVQLIIEERALRALQFPFAGSEVQAEEMDTAVFSSVLHRDASSQDSVFPVYLENIRVTGSYRN